MLYSAAPGQMQNNIPTPVCSVHGEGTCGRYRYSPVWDATRTTKMNADCCALNVHYQQVNFVAEELGPLSDYRADSSPQALQGGKVRGVPQSKLSEYPGGPCAMDIDQAAVDGIAGEPAMSGQMHCRN